MRKQLFYVVLFLLPALINFSCKKDVSCDGCAGNKKSPIANAGSDQITTLPKDSVLLDGSASSDPDGTITAYSWTKIAGPSSFNIVNASAVKTVVKNLIAGTYQIELKVTDDKGASAKDTVQIIVDAACDNSIRPQINAQLIPIGTLSTAKSGRAVASAGNKIVFAGGSGGSDCPECWGSSRVDIYDIITQTWSTAELSKGRFGISAIASGNKIFFAGGEAGDGAFDQLFSTVDIYDVSTNTWSVAGLSEPRSNIAAATVGNKVFFAGGEKDWDYNTSNRVDIYNTETNAWSTSQLSEARSYISAVTVNQKIYFAGGHNEDRWYRSPSNKIDIYDNATNSWSTSSLSIPMGFIGGITVADKIYWSSGCTVEIKNVNTWNSSMEHLFKPGAGQPVLKDNKILFLRTWENPNKFDVYDIATNTWSIGVLPQTISESASFISVNNTVYVAHGSKVYKLEF